VPPYGDFLFDMPRPIVAREVEDRKGERFELPRDPRCSGGQSVHPYGDLLHDMRWPIVARAVEDRNPERF